MGLGQQEWSWSVKTHQRPKLWRMLLSSLGDRRPHYPWEESPWSTFPVNSNLSSKDEKNKDGGSDVRNRKIAPEILQPHPLDHAKGKEDVGKEGNTLYRGLPEWSGARRVQMQFFEAVSQGNTPQSPCLLLYTLRQVPSHIHDLQFKWLTPPTLFHDPVFLLLES